MINARQCVLQMVLLIVMFSSFEGLKLHDTYLLEYEYTETVVFLFPHCKGDISREAWMGEFVNTNYLSTGPSNFLMLHEGLRCYE